MPEFTTIEEAQAEILRLNEELATRTTERDTLSQDNERLTKERDKSREIAHQYFLKLNQQYSPRQEDQGSADPDVPSCEDYAKTIKL